MNLHKDLSNFKDLITLTANDLGIMEFYIEKDYWVTYILKRLSNSEFKDKIVFKGGTSLSKAYNLIDRFSEDIDLQLKSLELNDNQKKNILKNIEKEITVGMFYLKNHIREVKRGNIRKTIYEYPIKTSEKDIGQISNVIVLEINSMSIPEPSEKVEIESYISKYLKKINREEFIKKFELESFMVESLSIERTFVEKIFAVLDYTFEKNPEIELGNKIRHIYDIYKLNQEERIKKFLNSDDFFSMASKVVVQNDFFGKRKNLIYSNSFLYTNFERIDKIKEIYEKKFRNMVFGELPKFNEIKKSLKNILERLFLWEKDYRNL